MGKRLSFTAISEILSRVTEKHNMSKPTQTFKSGKVELSVWQNNYGLSFSLRKNYFDKAANEWKSANSYYANELDDLAAVVSQARSLVEREGGTRARPQNRPPPPPQEPKPEIDPNQVAFEFEDEDDIPF